MAALVRPHPFTGPPDGRCDVCGAWEVHPVYFLHQNEPLYRVLFERAQDGYVNPTGGKTTGRERGKS